MVPILRIYNKIIALLAVLIVCLQFAPNAHADNINDAKAFINEMAHQVLSSIGQQDLTYEERQAQFRSLLTKGLDVDFVAKFVLGPYQRKASDEQVVKFTALLEEYIVLAYAHRFKSFAVKELMISDAQEGKRGSVIVSSDLYLSEDQPSIHIDWRTHKKSGDWKIIDISIEGLSMMSAQREEYVAVIRQGGGEIDHLIKLLAEKNTQLAERQFD